MAVVHKYSSSYDCKTILHVFFILFATVTLNVKTNNCFQEPNIDLITDNDQLNY